MSAQGPHLRIALLAALTALGSLAIHMFVPAMPSAAAELGADPSQIQLALTLYLAGVAGGQVFVGPLSDRIGRRRVLLGGALLFVAGSLLCWTAPSVLVLLGGRLVQAIGASSGLVAARASIGDTAGERGAADMALLTAIVMLSPMLAPMIGDAITQAFGWRWVFGVLVIAGTVCGVAIHAWIGETATRASGPSRIAADWGALARNRGFLRNVAIGSLASCGLFIYLSAAPFLLIERYGVAQGTLGPYFGIVAFGAGAGALAARWLARRREGLWIMRAGSALAAGAALLLLAGGVSGLSHAAALVVPMAVLAFGGGLVSPNAMTAALAQSPGRIGTAVSFFGAVQMATSAGATFLISILPSHDPLFPSGVIMTTAGLAALLCLTGHHRENSKSVIM